MAFPPPTPLAPDDDEAPPPPPPPGVRRRGRRSGALQRWSRLLHVYSSMVVFALVLFFGVTGITLNHPGWTFGVDPSTSTSSGVIPASARDAAGAVDLLSLSQALRADEGVKGDIAAFGLSDTSGYLSYRGPGYAADVQIDPAAGTYQLTVERQGLVGVLNDLHRGRATSALWGWVIDIAGTFLVVTALAGLVLQLALRRRRTAALVVAFAGGVLATAIAVMALA